MKSAMHLDRTLASSAKGDGRPSAVSCDALLERFLRVQPGRFFCLPCLARMINAPLGDVRVAAERLRVIPGHAVAVRRCSNCDEWTATLGSVPE